MGSSDAPSSESATTPGGVRQRILLDTSVVVDEGLTDVPVLVRLGPTDVDYGAIAPDGSDVRFFDATGTFAIPFEIEAWKPDDQTDVWVLLPEVPAGVGTVEIQLGYGDAAEPAALPSTEVWRNDYVAVWHLPSYVDATGHGHDLTASDFAPQEVIGMIGEALQFVPEAPGLEAPHDLGLQLDGRGTVEAWVNPLDVSTTRSVEHRMIVGKGRTYALATVNATTGRPMFAIGLQRGGSAAGMGEGPLPQTWRHLVGTVEQTADSTIACLSVGLRTAQCGIGGTGTLEANELPVRVGSPTAAAEVDEVRISSVNRSRSWVSLQERALLPDFATFLAPEPQ